MCQQIVRQECSCAEETGPSTCTHSCEWLEKRVGKGRTTLGICSKLLFLQSRGIVVKGVYSFCTERGDKRLCEGSVLTEIVRVRHRTRHFCPGLWFAHGRTEVMDQWSELNWNDSCPSCYSAIGAQNWISQWLQFIEHLNRLVWGKYRKDPPEELKYLTGSSVNISQILETGCGLEMLHYCPCFPRNITSFKLLTPPLFQNFNDKANQGVKYLREENKPDFLSCV